MEPDPEIKAKDRRRGRRRRLTDEGKPDRGQRRNARAFEKMDGVWLKMQDSHQEVELTGTKTVKKCQLILDTYPFGFIT